MGDGPDGLSGELDLSELVTRLANPEGPSERRGFEISDRRVIGQQRPDICSPTMVIRWTCDAVGDEVFHCARTSSVGKDRVLLPEALMFESAAKADAEYRIERVYHRCSGDPNRHHDALGPTTAEFTGHAGPKAVTHSDNVVDVESVENGIEIMDVAENTTRNGRPPSRSAATEVGGNQRNPGREPTHHQVPHLGIFGAVVKEQDGVRVPLDGASAPDEDFTVFDWHLDEPPIIHDPDGSDPSTGLANVTPDNGRGYVRRHAE